MLDEILNSLLAQQEAVKLAKMQACKERLRFILNQYGYEITAQMLDEVQAEEFAKAEIACHRSQLHLGL